MVAPGYRRSGDTALGILGWANALDFGVRGDGVVDDFVHLTQLLTGLAEVGGGVAVLPPTPGGYVLSQLVTVPSGVTVLVSNGVKFPSAGLAPNGGDVWDLAVTPGCSLLASYVQAIAWTLSADSTWTETPIQVTAPFEAGVRVRIEFATAVSCPTKGQHVAWTIQVDGVPPAGGTVALGAVDAPENSYASMAVGTYYVTPVTGGLHRVAFSLNGPAGAQLFSGIASTLYVTEQRP